MKKKLLIVEDEPTLVSALVEKFTSADFDVSVATNGQEGLAAALAQHPDIILLDVIMPVMDGMTMLYRLRLDPWGKDAKVILLTNLTDAGKVAESLVQGVNDYLIKSDWKLKDIVDKVNEMLA
ncbi:hypothetical protein A2368_03755 [Candidatus Collierbacteria bacterium RIFOXYB1_FULL_49_13]|uniref:Response regulatory domain-containing protein n=1 Tax=Candidatus Collierbacteria bacterium RIFOXYB1_FULL_49_13 TaxID=1817728 RepID=A0A1F5FIM9_9BACT|nr:MAG: hypothetical protein A2368_03755 [Candidatus Collierbacteria bacterium RIFOXYB1_FULL_49_13]